MDVYGDFDVVVCGGGSSGVSAAIAAARTGARAVLIERLGSLGGQMTVSGPPGFAYAHMFNNAGEEIIGGLLKETHHRLLAEGHALPYPNPEEGAMYSFAFVDPDWWELVIFEMLQESGVKLLLHSLVVDVVKQGDAVRGVVVENTSGRQAVLGKVVIDCTGEGDVASRAGAPFEHVGKGDPYPIEPPSLAFTMDGIDWDELFAYVQANADEMAVISPGLKTPPEKIARVAARIRTMSSWRELVALGSLCFHAISEQAVANGDYHPYGDLGFYFTPREGGVVQAIFQHSAQVADSDCTDVDEMTAAEIEARRQMAIAIRAARKYLPGFGHAYVTRTTTELRIRETRRILCDYQITWDDANAGRKFPDVIGKCAMEVGSRHVATIDTLGLYACGQTQIPDGGSFDIPYRSLVPRDVEGMLVAGKMISATREASMRFLPETMETGQAAGVAAALCSQIGTTPRALESDVAQIQTVLRGQGVILTGTH